jgi:hypothetical protein
MRRSAPALLLLLANCAGTRIETPYGTYRSSKDVSVTDFHLVVDFGPTGQPSRIEVNWGGARGDASPVIAQQAAIARSITEAGVEAAIRAFMRP